MTKVHEIEPFGESSTEILFKPLLMVTAQVYGIMRDLDETELRRVLAELSVFRGPGMVARDLCMEMIRDELLSRRGTQ